MLRTRALDVDVPGPESGPPAESSGGGGGSHLSSSLGCAELTQSCRAMFGGGSGNTTAGPSNPNSPQRTMLDPSASTTTPHGPSVPPSSSSSASFGFYLNPAAAARAANSSCGSNVDFSIRQAAHHSAAGLGSTHNTTTATSSSTVAAALSELYATGFDVSVDLWQRLFWRKFIYFFEFIFFNFCYYQP